MIMMIQRNYLKPDKAANPHQRMATEVASTPKFLAFHQFEFHINCWIFNACACLYHFVLVHFYLIDSGQSPPFQKYVMFWVCPYDCNALCVCAFSWVTIKLHHSRRGWKCALQSGSKCLQFSRKPSLLPRLWRREMMKELIEEALEEGGVEGGRRNIQDTEGEHGKR